MFEKLSPYFLLFKIIGVLALLGALTFAWHKFTQHYVDIGIAEQKVETDKFRGAYTLLSEFTTKQTESINRLGEAAKQAQKNYLQAVKKNKPIVDHQKEKITAIGAIHVDPKATCEVQVEQVIKKLDSAL